LVVDSPAGLFEFSDMSMVDNEHPFLSRIEGKDVSSYIERYAKLHDLDRRIRLRTRVIQVTKLEHGWTLLTQSGEIFQCDKLIISTGLTSDPKKPTILNEDGGFSGPVMHTCSLGINHTLLTAPEISEVVVVGGSKSAIETVCICIEAGKFVHWVIRYVSSDKRPPRAHEC
jgi:dimethylaniline monooxygenase (N-oxide forming)